MKIETKHAFVFVVTLCVHKFIQITYIVGFENKINGLVLMNIILVVKT